MQNQYLQNRATLVQTLSKPKEKLHELIDFLNSKNTQSPTHQTTNSGTKGLVYSCYVDLFAGNFQNMKTN